MTNNFVSFGRTLVTQIIDNEVLLLVSDKNPIRVEMVTVSNLTNSDIMISLTQTGLLENPISTFKIPYQLKGNQTANILQGSYLLLTDTDHLKIKTSSYQQKASVSVVYRTYNEDTADMQNNLNEIHASLKSLTQSHSDLQSRVATISASHEELSNSHGELNSLVQNDLINYINDQDTSIYDTLNQLADAVTQDLASFKKEINDKSDSIITRIDQFYNDVSEYVTNNEEDKQYNIKQPLEELQTQFEELKKYIEKMISNTNGNIDIRLDDALNQFNIISKSEQLKVFKDNQYLYELDFIDKDNVIKPEEIKPQEEVINNGE